MGNSIFFEQIKLFWLPGRFGPPVNILQWLFIVWVVNVGILTREKHNKLTWRDLFGPPLVLPEEGLLILLAGLWAFNFISSLYSAIDFAGVFLTGVQLGCMFLGYLFVRGIVSNATKRDIDRFLATIILINAIAAMLYILNQGLHFPIYEGDQYLTEIFMGTLITRTFWWMPRFYFLSMAYVISRSKWNLISIALLIITFASAFFSYSRNTFIIYGCIIALALIISAFKGNISRSLLRLVILIGTGIVLYWVISLFFPSEWLYLMERFQNINSSATIIAEPNFAVRLDDFNRAYEMLRKYNLLTGLGMVTIVTNPAVFYFTQWTADITWVAVLYRYGLIGIVLFAAIFLIFGIRTLIRYFKTTNSGEEEYWLMFFLVIVGTVGESFFSWTILDPRNYTLALWFLVFITIRIGRTRDLLK